MKFMFWNMRGFGRPTRRVQLKEYIREDCLDGAGILETIRGEFTEKELDNLSGGSLFRWIWKPDVGHSEGILVGVKDETYEVEESEVGENFFSMVLRNRLSSFRWELITDYELTQHNLSAEFISESSKFLRATLPILLGGDFNLIRFAEDKNNNNINQSLMDKFNTFIDLHEL
jgi:hypothetical protein